MTHYETIKEYIRNHPGTTCRKIRRELPQITHDTMILLKMVKSGEAYRKHTKDERTGRKSWGYFLKEDGE